ncbi:DNA recombination protein RmuC [soil metagenome]
MLNFLYLIAGICIGGIISWLFLRGKNTVTQIDPRTAELDRQNAGLTAQLNALTDERKRAEENQKVSVVKLEADLESERNKVSVLTDHLARKEAELDAIEKRLHEQKAELENLQKQFTEKFENLANRIFEEKSKKFTEQNKTQLDDLLKPLGEKIKDFEKKVTDVYTDETKERATLKGEITKLFELNQQMAKEANNLTRALKGETKTQGNWGELILETILEKSGLKRGYEYLAQGAYTTAEGKRVLPDIVINLPDGKHIVLDSKVSLVAYERYFSATESDDEKAVALKEHIVSVRKHVKDLSEKNYQSLYSLNSIDFVLLFMPVETAFSLALHSDQDLFHDAIGRNVVIVSPSTLLATLKTISYLWTQEKQNRNVIQIADEAASMYEKFVGFTEALIDIGKKMDDSKKSYEAAMGRLSTGPGNVVKRIENLKKLGLKVTKSLDQKLIDRSEETAQD